jgi:hypothetical protein
MFSRPKTPPMAPEQFIALLDKLFGVKSDEQRKNHGEWTYVTSARHIHDNSGILMEHSITPQQLIFLLERFCRRGDGKKSKHLGEWTYIVSVRDIYAGADILRGDS